LTNVVSDVTVIVINGIKKPLRPKDIKKILDIGNDKLQELLERRDFPSYKIGRNWYIDPDLFVEWTKKQMTKNK